VEKNQATLRDFLGTQKKMMEVKRHKMKEGKVDEGVHWETVQA
jgi:hypothetical protein